MSQVDDWAQRPEPENTNLLVLHFDHGRIAVRPSGTEPKVKAYLEWRADGVDLEDVTAARAASRLTLDELATAVRGWFTD